jgi:hypothetical protein
VDVQLGDERDPLAEALRHEPWIGHGQREHRPRVGR